MAKTKLSTAYIDPLLLPLLSTERLSLLSAGAELTRAEKTALVASDEGARKLLDVCVEKWHVRQKYYATNCSRCWKCVRTMATLEALGKLEHFDRAFDLQYYFSRRMQLLRGLSESAASGNSVDQEVLALLRAAGLDYPRPRPKALKWFGRLPLRVKRRLVRMASIG